MSKTRTTGSAKPRGAKPATRKIALIPDIHAPRHDKQAWRLVIDALKDWKPDVVIQLGDLIDLACVSSYSKHPAKTMSLAQEVKSAQKVVADIASIGAPQVVVTLGNHSVRAEKYLVQNAPDFLPFFQIDKVLGMHRPGWTVVPYKSTYVIGQLRVTHDVGRAGCNAARQSVIDVGDNIVFGHTHRMQVHYQGTQAGKRHVGATLGWLGNSNHIDYMHRDMVRRDWQLGFGVAHMLPDGRFWLQAIPIVKNTCIIDGRVYGRSA